MDAPSQELAQEILSGSDRSLRGRLVRGLTAIAEPIYAAAMAGRNLAYSQGWRASRRLPSPTVSVGNITTGGTGKTPVVRWLAGRLSEAGKNPAVLLRGYRTTAGGVSDEQQLLARGLPDAIPVIANPNRFAGAEQALRQNGKIDTFVLDDGFQHRKVKRDFDLVLVNATEPFGFGHVLPRGLLREPMAGLRRADALLITRSSQVDSAALAKIESIIKKYNSAAPIYHADHVHTAIWMPGSGQRFPIAAEERCFVFCGIADPRAFTAQFPNCVGHQWFSDHHDYTADDLRGIVAQATAAGARRILTTEKDWVKIAALPSAGEIGVVEMEIRFAGDDEQRLLGQIREKLGWSK
jgi:tetraacyldisaccharide 4'-kinase